MLAGAKPVYTCAAVSVSFRGRSFQSKTGVRDRIGLSGLTQDPTARPLNPKAKVYDLQKSSLERSAPRRIRSGICRRLGACAEGVSATEDSQQTRTPTSQASAPFHRHDRLRACTTHHIKRLKITRTSTASFPATMADYCHKISRPAPGNHCHFTIPQTTTSPVLPFLPIEPRFVTFVAIPGSGDEHTLRQVRMLTFGLRLCLPSSWKLVFVEILNQTGSPRCETHAHDMVD